MAHTSRHTTEVSRYAQDTCMDQRLCQAVQPVHALPGLSTHRSGLLCRVFCHCGIVETKLCFMGCAESGSSLICTVQGSNDFVEDLGMEQPTRMDLDFVAHGSGDDDAKHAVRASDYRLPRSARRPGAQVSSKQSVALLWGLEAPPHSAQLSGSQIYPRLGCCLKCSVG